MPLWHEQQTFGCSQERSGSCADLAWLCQCCAPRAVDTLAGILGSKWLPLKGDCTRPRVYGDYRGYTGAYRGYIGDIQGLGFWVSRN